MADIPIGDLRVVSVDLLVETLLRLQKELREFRAERDGLMQTLRDEIDENLRLRELGGALPDENITAMTERLIRERNQFRDAAKMVPTAWQVWCGLGNMQPYWPVFRTKEEADDATKTIKTYTEVRPLWSHASAAPQPVVDTKDAAPEMVKGGRYNWKHQKERLIYLGRNRSGNGFWHQFAKVDSPADVWCEVVDADLHMIEKTPQPVSEPAENSFEWFQLEIQRLQHHVTETWPDWMQRTSGLSTATFPTVGAVEVPMPEENILKIRALDSAEVRWIDREALRTYGEQCRAAGYAAGEKDAGRLPMSYGGCNCACHRTPGVRHYVACCKPLGDAK